MGHDLFGEEEVSFFPVPPIQEAFYRFSCLGVYRESLRDSLEEALDPVVDFAPGVGGFLGLSFGFSPGLLKEEDHLLGGHAGVVVVQDVLGHGVHGPGVYPWLRENGEDPGDGGQHPGFSVVLQGVAVGLGVKGQGIPFSVSNDHRFLLYRGVYGEKGWSLFTPGRGGGKTRSS